MGIPRATVVDYGVGNLLSVCRAIEHCGAQAILTDDPTNIENAERIVFPGVGAFGDAMDCLRERNLVESIAKFVTRERPFLGICLGMQMMMDRSCEFGTHQGLGLIRGDVRPVPDTGADGRKHKIPHIGWNGLNPYSSPDDWRGTILEGTTPGDQVYFVHSFESVPDDGSNFLATCDYNGLTVTAAIRHGSLYGCQFHPEKSGKIGLGILKKFLEL